MKKAPLKPSNSHEECFIKYWKTDEYILNELLYSFKL